MNYNGEGIMSQINSLIAPPQASTSSTGGNKKDSSSYKKSGRSNKDICCSCGDGGEMLACIVCGITIHWLCADPPIDEDVRPKQFKCNICLHSQDLPSSNLPQTGKGAKKKIGKKKGKKVDALRASAPLVAEAVKPTSLPTVELNKLENSNTVIGNIFGQLMPQVIKLNPVEFSLPNDFPCYDHQFPGSSRQLHKKSSNGKPKPLVTEEADIGTCIKPTVFCFHCSTSSRMKPLIKCDFCSAYYHFDCLNPPMITPPIGIWQCPLHVEPFLEKNVLNSVKLSERVRLWDETKAHVNHPAVITKFFRKAHRNNPPFHHKVEMQMKGKAQVPEFIVRLYEENHCDTEETAPDTRDVTPPAAKRFKIGEEFNGVPETSQGVKVNDNILGSEDAKLKIESPLDILARTAVALEENMVDLKGLDLATIKELAARKLFELQVDKQFPEWKNKRHQFYESQYVQTPKPSLMNPKDITRMRPVLALVCVNTMMKITLRSKSVSIGTGDSVILNLAKMGGCRGISPRHANIAYDHLQARWELVNYSPYGTIVDNCFLGCDFTPELREPNKYSKLPENSLSKYLIDRNKAALEACSLPKAIGPIKTCGCNLLSASPSLRSWEGPIPLKPHSRIQIGCAKLVVLTTEFVDEGAQTSNANPKSLINRKQPNKINQDDQLCFPPVTNTQKIDLNDSFNRAASSKPLTVKSRVTDKEVNQEIVMEVNEPVSNMSLHEAEKVKIKKVTPSMKRDIVISSHAVEHPHALDKIVTPLGKLIPVKSSPKKLVNYFDDTGTSRMVESRKSEEKKLKHVPINVEREAVKLKYDKVTSPVESSSAKIKSIARTVDIPTSKLQKTSHAFEATPISKPQKISHAIETTSISKPQKTSHATEATSKPQKTSHAIEATSISKPQKTSHTIDATPISKPQKTVNAVDATSMSKPQKTSHAIDATPISKLQKSSHPIDVTPISKLQKSSHPIDATPISKLQKSSHTIDTIPISKLQKSSHTIDTIPISKLQKSSHTIDTIQISKLQKSSHTIDTIPISKLQKTSHTIDATQIFRTQKPSHAIDAGPISEPQKASHPIDVTPISKPQKASHPIDVTPISKPQKASHPIDVTPISKPQKASHAIDVTPISKPQKRSSSIDTPVSKPQKSSNAVDVKPISKPQENPTTSIIPSLPRLQTAPLIAPGSSVTRPIKKSTISYMGPQFKAQKKIPSSYSHQIPKQQRSISITDANPTTKSQPRLDSLIENEKLPKKESFPNAANQSVGVKHQPVSTTRQPSANFNKPQFSKSDTVEIQKSTAIPATSLNATSMISKTKPQQDSNIDVNATPRSKQPSTIVEVTSPCKTNQDPTLTQTDNVEMLSTKFGTVFKP